MRKPTFLLKPSAYKTNELYAVVPGDATGDLNVSGYVGNGTRVNPQGFIETVPTDTPRIDYYGGFSGVLIEPSRKNQFLYSAEVSGRFAGSNVTVTANDTIAPDGTKDADKISCVTSIAIGSVSKQTTVTRPDFNHTYSFFVKFGNRTDAEFRISGVTSGDAITCLIEDDGTITTLAESGATVQLKTSEYYGNGWWRFIVKTALDATDTAANWFFYPARQDADLQGYFWLWGFQIETNPSTDDSHCHTSYIPTTTVELTRTSETITVLNTVTNNLIGGETNGALFLDIHRTQTISNASDFGGDYIRLGGTNGNLAIARENGNVSSTIIVENTDTTQTEYDTSETRVKVLFNIDGDNVDVWVNGIKQIATAKDFSLTLETFSLFGQNSPGIKVLEVAMFKKELTDAEAQAITR